MEKPLRRKDMAVYTTLRQEHGTSMKMFSLLEKLAAAGSGSSSSLDRIVHLLERYVDECHHGKEERAVFPALLAVEAPAAGELTEELAAEHAQARQLLDTLKQGLAEASETGSSEAFQRTAQSYAQLMRTHIRKENARLLPLCRERLQGQDDRQVESRMAMAEQDLLEPGEKEVLLQSLDELAGNLA
jgi:hemerythrin-like domain-containing protein